MCGRRVIDRRSWYGDGGSNVVVEVDGLRREGGWCRYRVVDWRGGKRMKKKKRGMMVGGGQWSGLVVDGEVMGGVNIF